NNAPRSAEPGNSRGSSPAPRGSERSGPPRNQASVPRPASPVPPRGYSSAADRGSFPRASFPSANNGRNQGSRPSRSSETSSRPSPNYGGRSYSRPAPSYGGGSYSRP